MRTKEYLRPRNRFYGPAFVGEGRGWYVGYLSGVASSPFVTSCSTVSHYSIGAGASANRIASLEEPRKSYLSMQSRSVWEATGSADKFDFVEFTCDTVQPQVELKAVGGNETRAALANVSEAIATIRSALSLQVKELAEALRVERPTVYAWIRGESSPQPENRERLAAILRVAQGWNNHCGLPMEGSVREEFGAGGMTFAGLLRADSIDQKLVSDQIKEIAKKVMARQAKSRGIRELAREKGRDLSKIRESEHEFEVLTGKRTEED